ncbi:uncharacterized protein LOC124456895 [Xenia sp. Carnegie-2017]|uniref:uncharacterized protein LOC124456895 n=1 Tax=Xenia sp. Carnegie-2017 TaxID=2897299 RepID=UPI001F03973B|nr:uncharacterized protein LOC124456895 [Xenia sp. Carnegie-2017]
MNVQEITKNSVPKMNVFFYTHQEEDTQLVNLQQMRDMYEKREIACIVRAMLKDPLKYVETAYELLDLADTHQHPITKNLKSHEKDLMGVPHDYDTSCPGDIFNALSIDPNRLQLDSFLYGVAHQCHLASERSRQTSKAISNEEIIKEIQDFNTEEITLTNTHVQCIAGALRASLEIWSPQFELFHIYFPCLCQVMDNGGIGYFSLTVGKTFQNSYVFMEQTSEKRPTRRKKPATTIRKECSEESERVNCFDGIVIYKSDVETLNGSKWLCDTIIDFFLRYYCKTAERKDDGEQYYAFSSFFQQKLLMKGHVSKRPLDLSGCNLHGVRRYTPKNMYQYKMIFVPVCDM